ERRERVHAVKRDGGRGIDREKPAWNRQVLHRSVERARDDRCIDMKLAEGMTELRRLGDFARRDLESNHLAALRQHAMRRIEDFATRRWNITLASLLALGTRAPRLAVEQ